MNIGMVVATESELSVFHRRFRQNFCKTKNLHGFNALCYQLYGMDVCVVQSGAGEIRAAAATQALISELDVEAILNFGVCGGLTDDVPLAEPLIVNSAIHYDFDVSGVDGCESAKYEFYPNPHIPANPSLIKIATATNPKIHHVVCASGDKFLDRADDKRSLHQRFKEAQICDMEAAGILLIANWSGIPALLIKAISDGVTGGAEEYHSTLDKAAGSCIVALENALVGIRVAGITGKRL